MRNNGYWKSIEDSEPAKHSTVLVTTGEGVVRVAEYRGSDWYVTVPGGWNLYVVAWMDLPTAYQPARRLLPVTPPPG